MLSLVLACKKCGAPIEPGARAALALTGPVLLDASCGACGKRALYELPARR